MHASATNVTQTKQDEVTTNAESSSCMQDKLATLQSQLSKLLTPEEQLNLLQFLMQNTLNSVYMPQNEATTDEPISIGPETSQSEVAESCEDTGFFIPAIFAPRSQEALDFENLLSEPATPYYADSTEFDIVHKLQINDEEPATLSDFVECETNQCQCNVDEYTELAFNAEWLDSWKNMDLSKKEKLRLLQIELNRLKCEQDEMEAVEMMTDKWRFILEKRRRLEIIRGEYEREDRIDADAYLNEIEMNMDYFTLDVASNDEREADFNFSMDQMLRFKTNRMAFNLRHYHKYVTEKKVSQS